MARLGRLSEKIYRLPYLHGFLSICERTLKGFWRDDCPVMAAAISFYAILSLIPLVLLMFSIAGYVLESVSQDYRSPDEMFSYLAEYIRAMLPFSSEDFITRLRGIALNREAYGLTGLVILFVTSSLVFRTLELSFNKVFKTQQRRSMLLHQLLFVAFIFGIGLLFLAVHYLSIIGSSVASGHSDTIASRIENFLDSFQVLRIIAPLLTGTLVFSFLLKFFSRQKVRNRASLFAGLLFSMLWMLATRLFAYYLTHLARFSLLYGSLASLAVMVVWVFYSSMVLLLCAEFAYALQDRFWPLPKTKT
jgi:membrane protein